jgi:hypothetical protein
MAKVGNRGKIAWQCGRLFTRSSYGPPEPGLPCSVFGHFSASSESFDHRGCVRVTNSRPSVRRPVVLNGVSRRRRQPVRARDTLLGAEALDTPLPGQLLVLLSRLHRAEDAKPRRDEFDA